MRCLGETLWVYADEISIILLHLSSVHFPRCRQYIECSGVVEQVQVDEWGGLLSEKGLPYFFGISAVVPRCGLLKDLAAEGEKVFQLSNGRLEVHPSWRGPIHLDDHLDCTRKIGVGFVPNQLIQLSGHLLVCIPRSTLG